MFGLVVIISMLFEWLWWRLIWFGTPRTESIHRDVQFHPTEIHNGHRLINWFTSMLLFTMTPFDIWGWSWIPPKNTLTSPEVGGQVTQSSPEERRSVEGTRQLWWSIGIEHVRSRDAESGPGGGGVDVEFGFVFRDVIWKTRLLGFGCQQISLEGYWRLVSKSPPPAWLEPEIVRSLKRYCKRVIRAKWSNKKSWLLWHYEVFH